MKTKTLIAAILSATFIFGNFNFYAKGEINMKETALIIIDIQNDYFPNGKKVLLGSDEASLKAKKLLEFFRANKLNIVHVQHIAADAKATFFLPDTDGVKIHKNVLPQADEKIVIKHKPNSFEETELGAYLSDKKIKNLIICGMQTNVCVEKTSLFANQNNYKVTVAPDATAAVSEEKYNEAVNKMKDAGIEIVNTAKLFKNLK